MRLVFLITMMFLATPAFGEEAGSSAAFRSTEFPLPRFVSLRSDEVYVRTGPGQKYPVLWVFKKEALPVEIVLEYDAWRKIRDFDGQQGWVHKTLLSGKRTGIINAQENVKLYKKPSENSKLQAYLQPKLLITLNECDETWCQIETKGYAGWLPKSEIWGVYEREKLD